MVYVPVLRYRPQERGVLKKITMDKNTIPLVEIVQSKPNAKMRGDFAAVHRKDFSSIPGPLMIDFPMNLELNKAKPKVRIFLEAMYLNPSLRMRSYQELFGVSNLIPVVSYCPESMISAEIITKEVQTIRDGFKRLAFRLFPTHGLDFLECIAKLVNKNDLILLDIDEFPHQYPPLMSIYGRVTGLAKSKQALAIIINSAIPAALRNKDLPQDDVLSDADNSIVKEYKQYEFDGFGDYAGIKKDPLSDGWGFSPGFIYYAWKSNVYIGYKGNHSSKDSKAQILAEFEKTIVPRVITSKFWQDYSNAHKENCPGCRTIQRIADGLESGASQAKWKGISMAHYIYTMQESL